MARGESHPSWAGSPCHDYRLIVMLPVARLLFSALRISVAVSAIILLIWWFGVRMPGKNISNAGPLSSAEKDLRTELMADVHTLGAEIGERNLSRYPQLQAAADFIETS